MYDKKPMELADTAEMMMSKDYKERFRAEYCQVVIRYQKLKAMLEKWDNGELNFTPTCPRSTYNMQIKAMTDYIAVLEARAAGGLIMDFGKALEAVKSGKKIFRLGWNGKGMFVVYQKGYPDGIPCNLQTAKAWGMNEGDLFKCDPYLQIKTADGSHAMWVPSIGDILAEDWQIIQ